MTFREFNHMMVAQAKATSFTEATPSPDEVKDYESFLRSHGLGSRNTGKPSWGSQYSFLGFNSFRTDVVRLVNIRTNHTIYCTLKYFRQHYGTLAELILCERKENKNVNLFINGVRYNAGFAIM